jgi:hypothetical protein
MVKLVSTPFFGRSKVKRPLKALFLTFDHLKIFVNTTFFRRSKILKHWWLIIMIKISHRWNFINLNTFDLLIAFKANKFFNRSKVENNTSSTLDLMIKLVSTQFIRTSKVYTHY